VSIYLVCHYVYNVSHIVQKSSIEHHFIFDDRLYSHVV